MYQQRTRFVCPFFVSGIFFVQLEHLKCTTQKNALQKNNFVLLLLLRERIMRVADHPPVVVDNGTGYTKLGFASNSEPSFVLPTCVSVDFDDHHHQNRRDAIQNATGRTPPGGTNRRRTTNTNTPFFSNATTESHRSLSDLNYSIGDDALARIIPRRLNGPSRTAS